MLSDCYVYIDGLLSKNALSINMYINIYFLERNYIH